MGTTALAIFGTVGLVVGIILAVAAAVYLVWKYHDQLWAIAKRVWGAMAPYLQPFIDIVKVTGEVIRDYLIKVFQYIWEVVKPKLLDAWKAITDSLLPALKELWDALQPLKPVLELLAIAIGGIIVTAIMLAIGAILVIVNTLVGILKPAIELVADVIRSVAQIIKGVIDILVGVFTGDWARAWNGCKEVVSGVWDLIFGIINGAVRIIVGAIKGLWDGVVAVFRAAYDILVGHSIVPDLINAIIYWFVTLPGKVLSAIAGLVNSLASWAWNAMHAAYDQFLSWGATILNWWFGLPGRIVSAVGSLGSMLYNAGWNAMVGLYNGFIGMGNKALDYVRGLVQSVRNLWPFSPAKEGPLRDHPMDKAGANMMKQLASGIQSKRALVLGSMKNIAYDVSQVQPSAPVVSANGSGPGGNGSGGGNNYQTFHINTQEIDPTKHAADLGWEIARRRG
jgi:hypothetical protein